MKHLRALSERVGLLSTDPAEFCLIFTLITIVVTGPSHWYSRVPLVVLGFLGLSLRSARNSPWLWFSATLILLATNFRHWATLDNHKHLLGVWTLAVYFSLLSSNLRRCLRDNAQALLTLVLVLAAGWKLASTDFRSGLFFEFTLLTDERFALLASQVGRLSQASLVNNREILLGVTDSLSRPVPGHLTTTPQIAILAAVMSHWTLAIEAVLALAWVIAWQRPRAYAHHVLLWVFVLTTYLVAPVIGFGCLLLVLGFTATRGSVREVRLGYIACTAIVLLYKAPWAQFVLARVE